MIKETILLTIAFTGLAAAWHVIYVQPRDEMRRMVHGCMVDIDDHSYQGFVTCKRSLNPNNR